MKSAKVISTLLIVIVFSFIIISLAFQSAEGLVDMGTKYMCTQKAALKLVTSEGLAEIEAKMPTGEEIEIGGYSGVTSDIYCYIWDCPDEPDIDTDEVKAYYKNLVATGKVAMGETFHLGPECGSLITRNTTRKNAITELAKQVDSCWRYGSTAVVEAGSLPCVYTFALVVNEEGDDITECEVAKELYLMDDGSWGDRSVAPNVNIGSGACRIEVDGKELVDLTEEHADVPDSALEWTYGDIKTGADEMHFFTLWYHWTVEDDGSDMKWVRISGSR